MDDETIEVPLPRGTLPNQESITTQPLPVLGDTVRIPRIERTLIISTLPVRLLGDPILTMAAPVADETPLYDQLNGRQSRPPVEKPRRRMPMGDRFLVGLGVAVVVSGGGMYGMVTYGWGAGPIPHENAATAALVPSPGPLPAQVPILPTVSPMPSRRPVESPRAVPVAAPHTYSPAPSQSIVVIASPSPSKTPEPSPTPSHTPAPSTTPPASPTPSRSPSDTPSSGIILPTKPKEPPSG